MQWSEDISLLWENIYTLLSPLCAKFWTVLFPCSVCFLTTLCCCAAPTHSLRLLRAYKPLLIVCPLMHGAKIKEHRELFVLLVRACSSVEDSSTHFTPFTVRCVIPLCAVWYHCALCATTTKRCVKPLCAVWNHCAPCYTNVCRVISLCAVWYHCAPCNITVRRVILLCAVWWHCAPCDTTVHRVIPVMPLCTV